MNDKTVEDVGMKPPQNSISIYRTEAADDFPVLKAFQQYIDAEQAKARKRLAGLCAFFVILMVIVIGVFLLMLNNVQLRNQSLNDKLIELVSSKGNDGNAVKSDVAMQSISEMIRTMQKEMTDRKFDEVKQAAEMAKAAAVAATQAISARQQQAAIGMVQPQPQVQAKSANEVAMEKKLKEDAEQLKKAQALLFEEKLKLRQEREKLRQEEIERQRRKLYPEYYRRQDQRLRERKAAELEGPTMRRNSETGAITYFEEDDEELDDLVKDLPKPKAKTAKAKEEDEKKSEDISPLPPKVKLNATGKKQAPQTINAEGAKPTTGPKNTTQPKPTTEPKPMAQPKPKQTDAKATDVLPVKIRGKAANWRIDLN